VPPPSRPHAGDTGDAGAGAGEGNAEPASPGPPSPGPPSPGPADPGLLRIEFTSPAKPALITRVSSQAASGDTGSPPGESGVAEFRYLVVPLRAAARA
jgi:hypothetical protein